MRNIIEDLIFSDASSYDIYVHTGVNQGLIGDLKDGYLTIDSIPYVDAEDYIIIVSNVNPCY